MPITQDRMLEVLRENEQLAAWIRSFRDDLLGIISTPMGDEAKLVAIANALLTVQPPLCLQCAIERDHFRRAQKRNLKQAARMRRVRLAIPRKGDQHELDG